MRAYYHLLIAGLLGICLHGAALAQGPAKPKPASEEDYYRLIDLPIPANTVLEVGGLDWLDPAAKKRLAVCTRRGELWVVDNPYADAPALAGAKLKVKDAAGKTAEVDPDPKQIVNYTQMLFGLHEPLGLVVNPKNFPPGIYMAQRTELTRVVDENGDDRVDLVETFNNGWEVSGNYHEYAFGPKLDKNGFLWITLNRPFGGGQEPQAYWRGWAVKVDNQGKTHPVCPGLRSPCGLGMNLAGDMFYTDNQGDWTAVCKLSHLKTGMFQGEAVGLQSCDHPLSTMKHPGKGMPKSGLLWGEAVKEMPWLVPPAVWFPYAEMGRSHSDVLCDDTGGKFGPFGGQLFVGDQGNAIIVRVSLEKVDGEYQGACYPFRKGLASGVLRMCWGHDGSMFVGGTNRGWGGGARPYCLQRLAWTGETPLEILETRATRDGFALSFTRPVDKQTAGDLKSYAAQCWTYRYHSGYGDKQQNQRPLEITAVEVAADGLSARLTIPGLEAYHVVELRLPGVRGAGGAALAHPVAWYTLNRLPK